MDPSGHSYEDFEPPHRLVREPLTHTLSVDLANQGYKKEHIRVQLVYSQRQLIVSGERPVAGDRWRRFRLVFKLPDDCDSKGVQARFEKGVVFVTMPGLKQELVSADASDQQKPASPAANKPTDAAAVAGVQGGVDGDRAAPKTPAGGAEDVEKDQEMTKVQKEGAPQQRATNSAKDGGRDDDAREGGDATPTRQGYAFLHGRKKTATTAVLGVVLFLISLGIYIKYNLEP